LKTKQKTQLLTLLGLDPAPHSFAGQVLPNPSLFAGQKWPNPLGSSAEPLDLTIQREQVSSCQKLPIAKTEHLC
jgi:hypothetical protein